MHDRASGAQFHARKSNNVLTFPQGGDDPQAHPTEPPRQYTPADWQLPKDVRARFIKAHKALEAAQHEYGKVCNEITQATASRHDVLETEEHFFSVFYQDMFDTLLTIWEIDFLDQGPVYLLDPSTGELLKEIPTETKTDAPFILHDGGDPEFERFGLCPICGQTDGYLNIGRDHIFVCHEHQLAWWVGSNLFSAWRDQTEADWQRNKEILASYTELNGHPDLDTVSYWWLASDPRDVHGKGSAYIEARREAYRVAIKQRFTAADGEEIPF